MAKVSCKTTWYGEMPKSDKIEIGVEALLADIGSRAASKMREYTKDHTVSKRLWNSITWQTSTKGSNAYGEHKSEDKIEKPKESGTLYVGSAAPHAYYQENGSGPHTHPEGSDEFVDSLEQWAIKVLGISRESPDAWDRMRFWYLVEEIRARGTPGSPFVQPTVDELPSIIRSAWKTAYKQFLGKTGPK